MKWMFMLCVVARPFVACSSGTRRVLVEYADDAGRDETLRAAQRIGIDMRNRHIVAAELPSKDDMLKLKRSPHIKRVEPDAILDSVDDSPIVAALDEDFDGERNRHLAERVTDGITMIQADQVEEGKDTKTLCIVDSGFGLGHPDLPTYPTGVDGANLTVNGVSYVWSDDATSHGTLLAGYSAALKGNAMGVRGVANEPVKLFITRGLRDDGKGALSMMLAAVDQCIDHGVDAISLSLGCPCRVDEGCYNNGCYSEIMEERFRSIVQSGILVFASAGNTGEDVQFYPASYPDIISVTAVNKDGSKWDRSNRNDQIELAALGQSALSTAKLNGRFTYARLSGTSAATAFVAAGAVLLWSNFPECSGSAIRHALDATAVNNLTDIGCDSTLGFGVVQLKKAYDMLERGCSSESVMFSSPANREEGICKWQKNEVPSTNPSEKPSTMPTSMPSPQPSERPTEYPSTVPSIRRTHYPSSFPSHVPTSPVTAVPSSPPQPNVDNIFSGNHTSVHSYEPTSVADTTIEGSQSTKTSSAKANLGAELVALFLSAHITALMILI